MSEHTALAVVFAVVGALVSLAHVEDGRVVDDTAGSDSDEPATPRPATPDRSG